jgi:uncharacterized delta-60 repeat protein
LRRFNADGSLDTSFGSNGKVVTDFYDSDDNVLSVLIQPDGKIIAAGPTFHTFVGYEFGIARYNADGSVDTTFGAGGKKGISLGTTNDLLFDAVLQPDGKIVAVGESYANFAVVRFNNTANGSSFDTCIQDDSNGNLLQVNTTTGDYQFSNCSGFTLTGTGTLSRRGSVSTLENNASDRRVMARIDTGINRATASIQVFAQGTTFTIADRNTTNNTCSCR